MKYIIFISAIFLLFSCKKEQEKKISHQVKSYRYILGSPYEVGTANYNLEIEKQGDTLITYKYFRMDTLTNQKKVGMEIEVRNDSLLLMKTGDFVPDVQRILQEKKIFYMGSKEIEISKFRRAQQTENKNDAIFITKEFGVINMLSYDMKIKMLYKIISDKSIGNTVNQINTYLERDTLGFYYQPTK